MHSLGMGLTLLALLLGLSFDDTDALDNGLARTPALGWSSWNYFEDDINETLVLGIAHAMAGSSNLKAAGYEYLNLDAGVWSVNRTAAGELQANPIKFPSGLRSLSSKIHALGLKLGLYINLGTHLASCGRTGSYGRYEQDAATLAKVGVDFVKVDYCGGPPTPPPCTTKPQPCKAAGHTFCLSVNEPGQCDRPPVAHCPPCPPAPPPPPPPPADGDPFRPPLPDQLASWQELRDALNKTGRPIYSFFCPRSCGGSLDTKGNFSKSCSVVDGPPHEWSAAVRQSLANTILTEYHNSGDGWENAMSNLDALLDLRPKPDASGGMQQHEYTAQFAAWSVLASTMIISADLRGLQHTQPACLELLTNAEILDVSQDIAAHAPNVLFSLSGDDEENDEAVYTNGARGGTSRGPVAQGFSRRMADGSVAVLLLNREDGRSYHTLSANWTALGLPSPSHCAVRDLINKADLPNVTSGSFSARVAPHSAAFVRISCTNGTTVVPRH